VSQKNKIGEPRDRLLVPGSLIVVSLIVGGFVALTVRTRTIISVVAVRVARVRAYSVVVGLG